MQPAYAVTADGGARWRAGTPARPLLSASFGLQGATRLWALDASGTGQPRLLPLTPDGAHPAGPAQAVPCSQTDGPPSMLVAVDEADGLALCQGPSGEGRLLLRTTTAGSSGTGSPTPARTPASTCWAGSGR